MAPVARITLRHPRGSTALVVASGEPGWLAAELADWVAGRAVFVVSSEPVWRRHGDVLAPLAAAAGGWTVLEVPDGEAAKSLEVAARLWQAMSRGGGRRDSRLIAFGGGSVGDVAGFVAGAFLRGIAFCQVPTTAVAQVDAAVGGKSAVNLPGVKNAVGLFHHPERVLTDPAFLATLGARHRRDGLVEVVKTAALLAPDLLARLEASWSELEAGVAAAWLPVVAAAQRLKAALVERDPEEADERRLLNLGHTLGHALEAVAGGALSHGEAVAHGLGFALRLGRRLGLGGEAAERLAPLLARLAPPPLPPLDPEAVWAALARDKKAAADGVRWVLLERPGRAVVRPVPAADARRELAAFLAGDGP